MDAQDDIPTTPAFRLWKVNHDHVVEIAERLNDWITSRRDALDPVSRRSMHSAEHQLLGEAERIRDEAIHVGFDLAKWERLQPTPEECQRLFETVQKLEGRANGLLIRSSALPSAKGGANGENY